MPHRLQVNKELGVIEVRAFGDLEMDDMRNTLVAMRELSEREGIRRVLADVTKVERRPGTVDAFEFFSNYPPHMRHAIYLGASSPPEMIEELRFIENVSENRGRRTKVFASRDDALQWLLGDD